jgi:hypothetical protein
MENRHSTAESCRLAAIEEMSLDDRAVLAELLARNKSLAAILSVLVNAEIGT